MFFFRAITRKSVPLARQLLIRQPVRTFSGLCGVVIGCLLMFVQLGFRDGLYNQSVRIHEALQCDLVVLNHDSTVLATMRPFPKERMASIYGDYAVQDVGLLRLRPVRWRNQINGESRNILAIGVDPSKPPLKLSATDESLQSIKGLFNILFDSESRKEFGPIGDRVQKGLSVSSEVNGYRLNVSGLIKIGPSFGYDGYIIGSRATVESLINDGSQGDAELGCVSLRNSVDVLEVLQRLDTKISGDVRMLTKEQFVDYERDYWRKSSSIGFVFNFGTLLGLVVGSVMVYQVLYTDVSDHLGEYATLRGMGYSMAYLCGVVIKQGIMLCLIGYIPSAFLGAGAYELMRRGTNIGVAMSSSIMMSVFLLITVSSTVSALFVTRRLWSADTAELF
jgi:putative ABC transport system permease protein